jgi:hypothetical protein
MTHCFQDIYAVYADITLQGGPALDNIRFKVRVKP